MTETLPISVVIPAYQREVLLARALRSVERQRPRRPAEVIVVDDCSSDATGAVADDHGARVIRHSRNKGEGMARNTGIATASQPWIALLDSDDEWLPHHLDRLWAAREGRVLVANSALRCGPDSAADRFHGALGGKPMLLESPIALVWPENPVPASGGMVRREIARQVGGYRDLRHCADLDFLLRCLEHGRGVVNPTVGVIYHVHSGQPSQDRDAMQQAHGRIAAAYADRTWWSRGRLERWRAVVAWDRFQRSRSQGLAGAAQALLRELAGHPQRPLGLVGLWAKRLRTRRQSARLGRDGEPSLALLARGTGPPDGWAGARVVDLRSTGRWAALAALAHRPTAAAVVGTRRDAALVRMLGIHPLLVP